jgi:predicted DCC family thiol-disulfide oxidoreductase YuxK
MTVSIGSGIFTQLKENQVILFDGVCNFCNSTINFVIKHDKKGLFRFAPLQSAAGNELLKRFNLSTTDFDSFVLIEGDKYYTKSTAALHVLRHLSFPYPLAAAFIIVPPFIRNVVYDFISRNRYKWFGKREVCMVPTKEVRGRFLN